MNELAVIAPRLAKLLPLLGSDKDGEVIATVRAINRTLSAEKLDWHDLVRALVREAPPAARGPCSRELVPLWQDLLPAQREMLLDRLLQWDGLSEFENGFCSQMRARAGKYAKPPSPKQLSILNQILLKGWQEGVRA